MQSRKHHPGWSGQSLLASVLLLLIALPAYAQTGFEASVDELRVDGLVLERQKYSFTLQTLERKYKVSIPNGTPMLMRLNKPTIDLPNRQLSLKLMSSAPDGIHANDRVLTWPLPDPVFVSTLYADENERDEAFANPVIELDRFVLSRQSLKYGSLTFGGKLYATQYHDQYKVEDGAGSYRVTLGKRRGLFHGFKITDLIPLQTSVWVQGYFDEDTIVATRIRFEYLGDGPTKFDTRLPNILSLGDIASYDYQRPLIEALAGKANVFHPPVWTGPSANWTRLHHYVGELDSTEPAWDVIAFNYGIRDSKTSRETFQENLRDALGVLKRTGARLIWVSSAPLPAGYPSGDPNTPLHGLVQGRMQLQNRWAASVLKQFPEVVVCDHWQIIKDNHDGLYDQWWQGRSFNFTYPQSIPLGRAIAETALDSIGAGEEPNPMSIHKTGERLNTTRQ